ncbi:MAG: hypothetical protein JWQ87_168 [Candidatus Sulfotelmatobacter sp.]|nr:hypothetical protein [Candidatus Sulfotelmatobacter sp.]
MAIGQQVPAYDALAVASGGLETVPADWMPATDCRPLVQGDPSVLWLEWFGDLHGFGPTAVSDYSFYEFLFRKGRELELAWLAKYAGDGVRVCVHDGHARSADSVRKTVELMNAATPVILHPALWWAPERIYGVPDLIVLSSWFNEKFANVLPPAEVNAGATGHRPGHYIAVDVKIKTEIDHSRSKEDLEIATAQMRMYSYMLGHLQQYMPQSCFLMCRDRVTSPFRIEINSVLNTPLDQPLAVLHSQWSDIRANGAKYAPWIDEVVEINLSCDSELWDATKKVIAKERTPGGDSTQVVKIGLNQKKALAGLGFPNLDSLLAVAPANVPFDQCKGIGKGKTATLLRAILEANRTGKPVFPPKSLVPSVKKFEFFVDYEFFQNENFDCQAQWPTLQGCSMIFMAGVGYEEDGKFKCDQFIAETECADSELRMLTKFVSFLEQRTGGLCCDPSQTAFYHWTPPEVWQSKNAADTHTLAADHTLRRLPWIDLSKVFLDGPGALPGCFNTRLKHVAKALGKLDPQYDPAWPEELAEGLGAMVMGWKSYGSPKPLECMEMKCLEEYLAADCRALWQILRWLRT